MPKRTPSAAPARAAPSASAAREKPRVTLTPRRGGTTLINRDTSGHTAAEDPSDADKTRTDSGEDRD
jgi:hypothetical protein